MYLVSAYFDSETNKILQGYINKIAAATGNDFMVRNNVPPHLTLSAIEARGVDVLLPAFDSLAGEIKQGEISIITVGQLMPQVIYVAPYLNDYLSNLEQRVFDCLAGIPETTVSNYYKPFSWLPHITLAKTLTREQMLDAVKVMQDFKSIKAKIVKIGLAKVNPHEDVSEISLC
jgi:2'-5' RNA ligase